MKKTTSSGKTRKVPEQPRKKKEDAVAVDAAFAPVAVAFARDRDVGLGRMFSSTFVLNVRGKIFAMFVKGRFVAKLPKERVDGLVSAGAGEYFDPGHGRPMKQWVALASQRGTWVALAREARAYVTAARK